LPIDLDFARLAAAQDRVILRELAEWLDTLASVGDLHPQIEETIQDLMICHMEDRVAVPDFRRTIAAAREGRFGPPRH
jgi:hypothetical protein